MLEPSISLMALLYVSPTYTLPEAATATPKGILNPDPKFVIVFPSIFLIALL